MRSFQLKHVVVWVSCLVFFLLLLYGKKSLKCSYFKQHKSLGWNRFTEIEIRGLRVFFICSWNSKIKISVCYYALIRSMAIHVSGKVMFVSYKMCCCKNWIYLPCHFKEKGKKPRQETYKLKLDFCNTEPPKLLTIQEKSSLPKFTQVHRKSSWARHHFGYKYWQNTVIYSLN